MVVCLLVVCLFSVFVCLFVCLLACLLVCLFVCLFVCFLSLLGPPVELSRGKVAHGTQTHTFAQQVEPGDPTTWASIKIGDRHGSTPPTWLVCQTVKKRS